MDIEFDIVNEKNVRFSAEKIADDIPENPFEKIDEKASDFWVYFIVGNTVILTGVFSFILPPVLAFVFAGIVDLFLLRVKAMRELRKKYIQVAKFTSPVFITSLHPDDDTVYQRTEEAKDLIRNAWANNPYVPAPPVFAIYENDEGKSSEEYRVEKAAFKREQLRQYHLAVKNANEGYYYRFILKQKDYPWTPTAQNR